MHKLKLSTIAAIIIGVLPAKGWSVEQWLIASQSEVVNYGQKITLDVVKPQHITEWPNTFKVKLSGNGSSEEIVFTLAKSSTDSVSRNTYIGVASKNYVGVVRAELAELSSNRLVMLAPSENVGSMQVLEASTTSNLAANFENVVSNRAQVVIASPGDEPALSANEPMYFVVGKNDHTGMDARFQLSFKYRPFDSEGSVATFIPPLSNVYFAYTQTTLWDLGENSSPFRDTSYRPSAFYRWVGTGRELYPNEWRIGAEHESNGQSGDNSRSLNTIFIRPTWNFDLTNGRQLSFSPKIQHYSSKNDNSDIQQYRGYVDWQLRYGREDGLILGGLYRHGTGGYSSGQLDVSYPVSDRIFARTGAFLHLQLLSGYGETLLDFNKNNDTQIRLGLSIAR